MKSQLNRPTPHPTEPTAHCTPAIIAGWYHLVGYCPECGKFISHELTRGQVPEDYSKRTCYACGCGYWITATPPPASQPEPTSRKRRAIAKPATMPKKS